MAIVACPKCQARNRVEDRGARMRPVCGRCGAPLPVSPLVATDATLQQLLEAAGDRPVLVDCWEPWCPPCRMIAPVIDRVAAEAPARYVVAKLNVDENPRAASEFQVRSIPALPIFKKGALVDQM